MLQMSYLTQLLFSIAKINLKKKTFKLTPSKDLKKKKKKKKKKSKI